MYGKYQAGLIGFKNDLYGLKSVRWWKNKCIDWCSAEAEEGKFGDQKYLDYIPIYFPKVKISNNLGINARLGTVYIITITKLTRLKTIYLLKTTN